MVTDCMYRGRSHGLIVDFLGCMFGNHSVRHALFGLCALLVHMSGMHY